MGASPLGADKYKQIIRLVANGTEMEDVVDLFGVSESVYRKVHSTISACKRNDIVSLKKYWLMNSKMVDAACKHYGIDTEQFEEKPAKIKPEEIVSAFQAAAPNVAPAADSETKVYLAQISRALNEQNELLRDLIDAVIPKYMKDIADYIDGSVHDTCDQMVKTGNNIITAVNTDSDLLFQQQEKVLLALNKLRKT